MSFSRTYETLDNNIKSLQLNFTQILTSGCHYTTGEIINNIKHINTALDNIKLDYEFQRGSKDWVKQFNPNEMKLNEINIKQVLEKGNELTQQLNTRLHIDIIKNKEQNQIREIHNWACDSLLEYLQALHPFASSSYDRLDNIAHYLGVTDRYVGYRNNLTRFENAHTIWADRKFPQTSTPDWKNWSHAFQHNAPPTILQQPPNGKRNAISSMGTTQAIDIQRPSTRKKMVSRSFSSASDYNSHLSRAGMTTKYPGQSETVDRYSKTKSPSYSPAQSVAQPDFTMIGRPLARLVSKSSFSEYTDRYTFPDPSKIERYPWLRS